MISTTAMRTVKATLLGAAALALWAVAPGCGPSVGAYCNKVCSCTGCSDSELDECVDDVDDARKVAEEEGCGSQFDAVLSCSNSELTCKDDRVDVDGCDSESEDLYECTSKVTGFGKNACERAADQILAKYEECGKVVPEQPSEPIQCGEEIGRQYLCIAGCFTATSCDCAGLGDATQCDQDEINTYSECVGSC